MSTTEAKHKQSETLHSGRFLKLCKYTYIDEYGVDREWEVVERTTRTCEIDSVDILAIIKSKKEDDKIILVKQYRPPLKKYSIELPAGLIDAKESIKDAAIRELKEETGYVGKVVGITPQLVMEPGLTNANCKIVHIEVDGDVQNTPPKQQLDDGENIEVIILSLSNLYSTLIDFSKKGYQVDAKLFTFAFGLNFK